MKQLQNRILFSIDLEEFDIPEEYGKEVSPHDKLQISLRGMQKLDALMQEHDVTATLFTTAFWAGHFPDYMKELARRHEIASHTYYHNSFQTEDLLASREVLQQITGQEITGIRMPRMQPILPADVKAAGYVYDSSLNPTWMPGRYNNFDKPRTLKVSVDGIWELPASVTPILRLPVFWLSLKNFPFAFYRMLCRRILKHDGYIVLYVHPWEFTDLSAYHLPSIVSRLDGDALLYRLGKLFEYLKQYGSFATHGAFVKEASLK